MNRGIRFRGKRCSDGKWVYGFYAESNYSWKGHKPHKSWIVSNAISNGGFFNILGRYAVKDNTIGQFTGLYDKNGKEVYEGDILKVECTDGSSIYKIVRFVPEKAAFCMANTFEIKDEGRWDIWSCVSQRGIKEIEASVIGNIHDNPELLK